MAIGDSVFQLVTFQLGEELYGVDIMDVKEIVKIAKDLDETLEGKDVIVIDDDYNVLQTYVLGKEMI